MSEHKRALTKARREVPVVRNTALAAGAEGSRDEGQRPFLFDLEPVFTAEALDSRDPVLFSHGVPAGGKDGKLHFASFGNPYLENEMRGFVRFLIKDGDMAPMTLEPVFYQFMNKFEGFVDEYLPGYVSISDYDFEELHLAYAEYLVDRGYELEYKGHVVVDKNMEIREYHEKNSNIYLLGRFYRFVTDTVYPDTRPEFVKDRWDIRKLGIPYSIQADRPRYTLNFTGISQPWFRETAKRYEFYRIQRRKIASAMDDLKAFRRFSEFLREKRPDINSFGMIDREAVEGYMAFLQTFGYVNTAYNRRLSVMKTFFELGVLLGFDEFPNKRLITNEDYVKVVHHLPKYFSDKELKQMNEHLQDLPVQHGRIMFVLENCGMRLSDLLGTTIMIDGELCIRKTENGYVFTYCMPKVYRNNTIPVNELVGEVILSAIEDSRAKYGKDCVYIFAKSAMEPISQSSFIRAVNNMSKDYDLRRDDGTPLRIRGHTFRGTVATQYANSGISLDMIRLMLGQQKIGVLKHYITIHSEAMNAYMEPIHNENEKLIRNIGNVDVDALTETEEELLLPLANGRCGRRSSESCRKANACYRCRMFHPQKEYMGIYRMQLQEAERNICMARAGGYDRILADNEDLAERLRAIIASLEE